jgi:hypothetical protein
MPQHHSVLNYLQLGVVVGIVHAALPPARAAADIVINRAIQENLASASYGGDRGDGGSVNGSNNVYKDTAFGDSASPISAPSTTAANIDPYGGSATGNTGTYISAIGNDVIYGSGSGYALATAPSTAPDVYYSKGHANSATDVNFFVDEQCVVTLQQQENNEFVYFAGPGGYVNQGAHLTPGSEYEFDFGGGADLTASNTVTYRYMTYDYNIKLTLTPFASVAAGANQSSTVLTGGGGLHRVTATIPSTGGGTLYGRFHGVDASNFGDSTQMFGAAAPTFDLPSGQLLIWDVSYVPTDASETGTTTLSLHFDPAELLPGTDLASLEVYHYVGGQWEAVATSIDPLTDTATISTDSFSPFALGLVPVPEPATIAMLAGASPLLLVRRRLPQSRKF